MKTEGEGCTMNVERRPVEMFRWLAAAALVLLIVQGAPFARAQGPGTPPPPIKVDFNPSLVGGDFENGTVTLAKRVPKNAKAVSVQVVSTSKAVKIAPLTQASLAIQPGQTSVSFEIVSSPVASTQTVQIYACSPSPPSPANCLSSPPGTLIAETDLVLAANGPASVSMNPPSVAAGGSSMGTVKLTYPAPPDVTYYANVAPPGAPKLYVKTLQQGGATVTLTSDSGVTVTPSATFQAGGTSATFSAVTSQSAGNTPQSSSCSMGPSTLTATITAKWEQSASGALQIQPQSNTSRYTSKTIRIDPSSLVGVSHDGQVLVLASTECSRMLKPGSVMFIDGRGVLDVGKVAAFPSSEQYLKLLPPEQLTALQNDNTTGASEGGIAVGVGPASLTDFINDGNVEVELKHAAGAVEPGGGGLHDPFADAAEPHSEEPTGVTPWKYSTTGTSSTYSFITFKNNHGMSGSVTANGKIAKAECDFLAVIHNNGVQEAKFTAAMDGSVDVDWLAQVISGNDIGDPRLRMRPLYGALLDDDADGIPFLFHIDANMIFKPGFGEKAAAKGHFTVEFKGDGGIDGFSPVVNDSFEANPEISSTTSSARAAHGAVVALNVPRFVLTFGTPSFLWATWNRQPAAMSAKAADFADQFEGQLGEHMSNEVKYPDPKNYFKVTRGAYVQWAYSVAYAGTGMIAMLPCQQYYQNYVVQAGIDKDMLGTISGSVPPEKGVEVFKKTGVTAIPSVKGCYPKK